MIISYCSLTLFRSQTVSLLVKNRSQISFSIRLKAVFFKIKKSMRAVFFLGGCGAYFEGKTLLNKCGSFLVRSV